MRVAQVSTWQVQCGIAGYTDLLCAALAEHGAECRVVPIDRERTRDLSVRELGQYFDSLCEQFADAEVVHIQHEFGFFSGSYHYRASIMNFRRVLRAARRGGRPVFVTFHTVPFEVSWASVDWTHLPAEQLVMLAARRVWRSAIAPLVRGSGAPRAIVHGRLGRRLLIDSGIAPESIAVVPHGTPPPFAPGTSARRAQLRARLGLAEDATVLAIFGFLAEGKGHSDALDALENLPDSYQLLLAGGPHPLDEHSAFSDVLNRLNHRPELRERVAVTGYLPDSEALACLDAVDIMLAPYRDRRQVSSGALGWALASGKPVIASRLPAFREIVEQAGCAELVGIAAPGELALAAERLVEDQARAARLVAGARAWCEANAWTRVAERHLELYAAALGRAVPSAAPQRVGAATQPAPDRACAPGETLPLLPAGATLPEDDAGPRERSESGAAAILRPTSLPDGRTLAFALDPRRRGDPLATQMLARGYAGDMLGELVLHLLRGGGAFLDVGAHLGSFTLAAAAQGSRVIAVEASHSNVRLLRTAVAYNGFEDVSVIHAAAAAEAGTLSFVEDGIYGSVAGREVRRRISSRARSVRAVRLDELLAELHAEAPQLIKIDVEGYELEALAGLGTLLDSPDAPMVIFESNAAALGRGGRTLAELHAYFRERDFSVYAIDREDPGTLVPFAAGELQVPSVVDFLALKRVPSELAPWRIVEPLTHADLVARLRAAAGGAHHDRGYAAAAYRVAPQVLREDPLLREMMIHLRRDSDPRVAAVALGEEGVQGFGLLEQEPSPNGRVGSTAR